MSGIILPYRGIMPKIHETAFIAPNAAVTGDVEIGEDSSVWFNVAMRGDVNDIKIGTRTNIQDGCVIHVTTDFQGTYIGDDVTVGHMALLHACRVGDLCLVGMGSILLDGSEMQAGSMLAAGSLLTPGKVVPKGQLWSGRPARYMRDMTPAEIDYLPWSAKHYADLAREYRLSGLPMKKGENA